MNRLRVSGVFTAVLPSVVATGKGPAKRGRERDGVRLTGGPFPVAGDRGRLVSGGGDRRA
jgi:hypothetical protein